MLMEALRLSMPTVKSSSEPEGCDCACPVQRLALPTPYATICCTCACTYICQSEVRVIHCPFPLGAAPTKSTNNPLQIADDATTGIKVDILMASTFWCSLAFLCTLHNVLKLHDLGGLI